MCLIGLCVISLNTEGIQDIGKQEGNPGNLLLYPVWDWWLVKFSFVRIVLIIVTILILRIIPSELYYILTFQGIEQSLIIKITLYFEGVTVYS